MPTPDRRTARLFQRRLLAWYARHARSLPWRTTRDPWRILVSEIMLQQTQVERVVPKFREFLARWPTPARLASARPGDVRRLWYPLGYNARPLRLYRIARASVARWGGQLPRDLAGLRRLDGVGRYTAHAVLAFAHEQDVPVVDTNVRRVVGRVFLGPHRARRVRGERAWWDLAAALVPAGRGYDWNQALMDFGATWCTPRRPRCTGCPMAAFCAARRQLGDRAGPVGPARSGGRP